MNSIYEDFTYQRYQEVELRAQQYRSQIAINERSLVTCRQLAEISEYRDHAKQRLVMELRAFIYGKDHPKKHIIRYPETWWEAVKERFAPAWFRDRWPVRYTEITASLEELYPEVSAALPDKNPVMRFRIANKLDIPIW